MWQHILRPNHTPPNKRLQLSAAGWSGLGRPPLGREPLGRSGAR